jgi:hypothetical protein
MREVVAGRLEQLLQIALRNPFRLRDPRRRDLGIAELAFDRVINALQQRGPGPDAGCFRGVGRFLTRQGQQHLGKAQPDRVPGLGRQRFQRFSGDFQRTAENISQAIRSDDDGIAAFRQADLAATKTLRRH